MTTPKSDNMTLGSADIVNVGCLEVVFQAEEDAKGCMDAIRKMVPAFALNQVEIASDDKNVRWLLHVDVDPDWFGFVAGLMTGWQIAAEGS